MKETGSSLATFMDCPRKYFYKYEKMLDSGGYSSPLGLGTMVHAHVEDWTGKNTRSASTEEYVSIIKRIEPSSVPIFQQDQKKARGMFEAWADHWGAEDRQFGNDKWEWIAAEREFSFEVAPGRMHLGKIDGIVRHKEWNKIFVYELKTATDRDRDSYFHRLGVDRQVSANIFATQIMGIGEVDGILYDVMWKPGIRLKKEETADAFTQRFIDTIKAEPAKHFDRVVIYRKQDDLIDHLKDVDAQMEALDDCRHGGRFYRNTGSCDNFGSLCPYFSVCIEGNTDLESVYRKRDRKHPELSKELQAGD